MTQSRFPAKKFVALALVAMACARACRGDEVSAGAHFDRQVAPLLAGRCLDCHRGPEAKAGLDLSSRASAMKGGESGPALVAGQPDASLLWQYIEDGTMPPKKPLSAAEKRVFREWLAAGAPWGTDPIDPFRYTSAARAGYDWWSLAPLVAPRVPEVRQSAWVRKPLDAFILARLEQDGLSPSPEADRRVLLRRLSYDLTGLPPSPEEVAAFVADPSPTAYEACVDRLLASPHYGERWARHWLDIVRFGESNGFERDLPRNSAWPYRDWVVQALNRDLPYDEFVRQQIAGDVLSPSEPGAWRALGFLVAGPHDTVLPVSDTMRAVMRQDELEDIVGTVAQTFLGLTANCARCHDHKFDPISQVEYYRLAAALAGVEHGERDVPADVTRDERRTIDAHLAQLEAELKQTDERARARVLAARQRGAAGLPPPPEPLASWDFTVDLLDARGGLHATLYNGARRTPQGLVLDGQKAFAATEPLTREIGAKTLAAWVSLGNVTQRGGGVVGLQTRDGVTFDTITFAERDPAQWMAGSNFFRRTQPFKGPAEQHSGAPAIHSGAPAIHVAIAYADDGTITAYRNGQPYGTAYASSGPVAFKVGESQVIFGLRHDPPGGNKMLAATIASAALFDRALRPDEVARLAGVPTTHVAEGELLAQLSPAERARRQAVQAEVKQGIAKRAALEQREPTRIYTLVSKQPGTAHVLRRGNVTDPGPEARAGGIAAVMGSSADFRLPGNAADADRRRALALWITDARNPLFARVMANRLWHYHFGAGLIETPNDLGFNGGRPSHPELLDWLAAELIRERFSLKALHRTLVCSAAYRQSSASSAAAVARDAGNRLVWRKSPVRLEAEVVRDAMLAIAGKLDRTVGGHGYTDTNSYFKHGTQFYDPVEQVGSAFYRRTIYRMWARSGRSPFLDTFDCPDPSTPTPRRAVTTTPLQALTLLNNAFSLHMADSLAERLQRESGPNAAAQIDRAYRLAYGRGATDDERRLLEPLVAKHGLPAFCRVLFNSNEFIYLD